MNTIAQVILLSFTAILLENTIFTKALGTSTMFLAARSKRHYIGFGICITYFSVVSSALSFFADLFFKDNPYKYLFVPIVYVIIIGAVYTITLLLLWKLAYPLFLSTKKYIHVSAFNCAVLGALFVNQHNGGSFLEYIGYGLGTGIGFLLATYLVSIVYEKLYSEDVPPSFRGLPITFIYVGILAMAFYGLVGHQITF